MTLDSLLDRRIQWVKGLSSDATATNFTNTISSNRNKPQSKTTDDFELPKKPLYPYNRINQWLSFPKPLSHTAGLRNIGNTCFLNASLQVLLNLPPLVQFLQADHSNCSKVGFCSLCAIRKLSALAHSKPCIIPKQITSNIRAIRKSFRIGRQEDAHEFFLSLFGHMQDCITGGTKCERKLPPRVPFTSAVHQLFGFFLSSNVLCLQCDHLSRIYEPCLGISLDINRKKKTLLGSFERYFAKEKVENFKCDSCSNKGTITKWNTFRTLPNVLMVQLKRFSFHNRGSKVGTKIVFPEVLDSSYFQLPKELNQEVCYELLGIVVHHGSSLSFGHYTSFVKCGNGLWYHFDDEQVCQVSKQTVLNVENGYIAFYVKKESFAMAQPMESDSVSTPVLTANKELERELEVKELEFGFGCDRKRRNAFESKNKKMKRIDNDGFKAGISAGHSSIISNFKAHQKKKLKQQSLKDFVTVDTLDGWGDSSATEVRNSEMKEFKKRYHVDREDRKMDAPKKKKKKAKLKQMDLKKSFNNAGNNKNNKRKR
ncbi:hypothetical protein P9112_007963 [Eukaryota sp. TZLM1-RC]